tara:strand:- start:9996 stop:10208 length:213 start_codon:yes stop_codon:yes gene_type:complete
MMKIGEKVWFDDVDDGLSSGWYTVDKINGEVFSLSNKDGANVEAFRGELSKCSKENGASILPSKEKGATS